MVARTLALAGIGAYQRYVSPYKGFCCAHRAHLGGASCSALGARAIRRHGLRRGLGLLRARLGRCGEAYRRHHPRGSHSQRGSCDAPCDIPCDGSELRFFGDACQCCDCSWGERRNKKEQRHDRPLT